MSTVTRRDLAIALKERTGGTISGHDEWIKAFIEILSEKISSAGRVEIRGFGAFKLNTIKAHTTVNPAITLKDGKKRKKTRVPKTYTVDFRPSKLYKERLKAEHGKSKSKSKAKAKKAKSATRKRKKR